jgi:uncharacterized protein (DUF1810 family)
LDKYIKSENILAIGRLQKKDFIKLYNVTDFYDDSTIQINEIIKHVDELPFLQKLFHVIPENHNLEEKDFLILKYSKNINTPSNITNILDNIKKSQELNHENYELAFKEMKNGSKASHWIWYIFPALKIINPSHYKDFYDLPNFEAVKVYLEDTLLVNRLVKITQVVLEHLNNNKKPVDIFKVSGNIDVYKFYICMKCFYIVAHIYDKHELEILFEQVYRKVEQLHNMQEIYNYMPNPSLKIATIFKDELCNKFKKN